jgi:predicted nucleotidyltransferase
VDLIVRFEPGRTLLDHGGLVMDLRELLGMRVDVIDEDAMRPRFRERAMAEAVPL